MIRPDQIPSEVVEAAAKAITSVMHNLRVEPPIYKTEARTAIAAALNAWPGAELDDRWSPPPFLHLPLTAEARDDR